MVASSYAVVWREPSKPVCAGELTLGQASMRLDGALPSGVHLILDVPYAYIRSVRIGRAPDERIGGRPSVLVTTDNASDVAIVSAGGVGIVTEIAERLEDLVTAAGQ